MARLGRSQPFAPIIKRGLVSGLAGVTGDVTWTEANDILAAAGSVQVAGDAAWTETNDTLAAQGTLGVFGVGAWTESNDGLAAAGQTGVFASGAWAEIQDTIAASGTASLPSVTGDAAWTEANDNVSGTAFCGNADTHDPGVTDAERKRRKKQEEQRQKEFAAERAKREERRGKVIDAFERVIEGKPEIPAVFVDSVVEVIEEIAVKRDIEPDFQQLLENTATLQRLWDEFIERDDEEVLALL